MQDLSIPVVAAIVVGTTLAAVFIVVLARCLSASLRESKALILPRQKPNLNSRREELEKIVQNNKEALSRAKPVKPIPTVFIGGPSTDSSQRSAIASDTEGAKNYLHIAMFVSFILYPALNLILILLSAFYSWVDTGEITPREVQQFAVLVAAMMIVSICLVSFAMMPFGYNAKRTFGILDLILLTTISAIAIGLLCRADIEVVEMVFLAPWIYLIVMAAYGIIFQIRRWAAQS